MPGASIEGKNMALCLYISFALVATVALVWNPFRVCGLDYYEYKYVDLTTMNINIYIYTYSMYIYIISIINHAMSTKSMKPVGSQKHTS